MIPIIIDISEVADAFTLEDGDIDLIKMTIVSELTEIIYDSWRERAYDELNTSRNSYINGLVVVESGRFTNEIVLTGQFNNMVEFGVSAFDMKEGFSKSDKVKYNKNGGWYLTIPFKWAGSDSEEGQQMPKEIHEVAKRDGEINKNNIPSGFNIKSKRVAIRNQEINKIFAEYNRKSSIYMGIQKKTDPATNQNSYASFRRVGENSDPNSWIHTGIKAHNLAKATVESVDIDSIVDEITNRELIKLGF